jgi:hypothetical protein
MRPTFSTFKRGALAGLSALAIGLPTLSPGQAMAQSIPPSHTAAAPVSVQPPAGLVIAPGLMRPPENIDPAPLFNDPCTNTVRATTPDQLASILQSAFTGCVVIPRNTVLDMSGYSAIPVHSGVSLIGERGDLGSRPSLATDSKTEGYSLFELTGNDVRVAGLHFRGPARGIRTDIRVYTGAIHVIVDPESKLGRRVLITDNEFDEWTGSGIDVRAIEERHVRLPSEYLDTWARLSREDAGLVRIEHNYFHHNAMDGGGYGVTVGGGAYATIEGNVFDFNRHAVASEGWAHGGYIARFNYVLQGGYTQDGSYNQHFDVHGTDTGDNKGYGGPAGEYYEVAYNAIRGEQGYSCFVICLKTRAAWMLRGAPTDGAYFHDNVAVHDDLDAAVSLKWNKSDTGFGEDEAKFHFHASGNQFDTDHSGELATGDFDGDGRTDVFVANGTAWFFSRAGTGPWEFLHASNKLRSELGFADIDNDGSTDVLYRDPSGNVGYLKSGVVALVPLTTSPVPMNELRFGDFDGDGKTDIFYARNAQWYIWYGSTRMWTAAAASNVTTPALLFGEFDSVRGTDVAAVTSGMWAYSSGGTTPWAKLNNRLETTFVNAVAADFDGDGRTDIAFDKGTQRWTYSPDGRLPLRSLREGAGTTPYGQLHSLLLGDFDGGLRTQVVSFYDPTSVSSGALNNHFVIWRGGIHSLFGKLSGQAMR